MSKIHRSLIFINIVILLQIISAYVLQTQKPERAPGVVSKRKCREYSSYVFERKQQPILLINASEVTRDECGHKVVKLIIGGMPAERKEFPHMAAIGYGAKLQNTMYLCSGTILSKRFVLTAGHCLEHVEHGKATRVKLGVTQLTDTNHAQLIEISDHIPHPEYNSSSYYHDIALIKLAEKAKLNPFARPACLYFNDKIVTEKAIASGWGQTSPDGDLSNILLKVVLNIFEHDFCRETYRTHVTRKFKDGIVKEMQFCAGGITEAVEDTCPGDSGGPLQIYHTGDGVHCMYDIVGVTSFGKDCSGAPSVYVRVSQYVKWIEDVVWPQK